MNLLAFDFGGTSIKYTLWQENEILDVINFPTPSTWNETKEKLLSIKLKYDSDYKIDGVAFSFPGCVNHEKGEIQGYSAIPYIHHFPIQQELSELLQLPISMENDANCAALAEIWKGVAKKANIVLFVVVGTGVGGSLIINGKIYTGAHLYGGELGYMYLNHDKKLKQQTLSDLGTAVGMAVRYCENINVPIGTYSGKEVFELAKKGDEKALSEVETFYRCLSIALFNLQTIIDPEVIVIGGGISANSEIIDTLKNRVNDLLKSSQIKDFTARILPCYYKNNANLIGAIKNFYDRIIA